jgi:DNA-binding transcriptional regulator YhcF (GntR family)
MWLLKSPAWLSLTAAERAVYIQLASRYNGSNNGKVAFSVRDAARECRISKDTAGRAYKALVAKGFIEVKTPGGFSRKVRHAAEWLLTEYRDDVSLEIPKKTFMHWKKIQNTVP